MHGRNAAIATLLLGLTVAPVNAATYSYTGNNYSIVTGNYTKSMSITGFFKVASPLNGNFNGPIMPQSYSFSDGLQTLTNANSSVQFFDIATNSGGDITATLVTILGLGFNQIVLGAFSDDATNSPPSSGISSAFSEAPGTWQRTDVSVVPVPAALPLLASGLGALGLIGWRRKRKAAAAA
jgi:hypothetical protein